MIRSRGSAIAIVGMACRFPGAPNVSRYWQMIRAGRHAFGPPPADRWNHAAFFSEMQRAVDRYYAPHGAFVDDVRAFARRGTRRARSRTGPDRSPGHATRHSTCRPLAHCATSARSDSRA